MKHKKWSIAVSTLLVLLFSLTACSEEPTKDKKESVEENAVSSSITPVNEKIFEYTVVNNTKEAVTFDFTSGQRFDYTVSSDGEVLHQLSAVSMYPSVLGSETIEAGNELSYEFEIPDEFLKPGEYTLKAWLTISDGVKFESETKYSPK